MITINGVDCTELVRLHGCLSVMVHDDGSVSLSMEQRDVHGYQQPVSIIAPLAK